MTNVVYDKLTSTKESYIFNKWIVGNDFKKNRDQLVHFSVAPTILKTLGFSIEGLKYGLGNSALISTEDYSNEDLINSLMENLDRPSDYYNSFWMPKN